jgi:cobalt-precorrin 5A hydrolase / precorrin-3B C17-methyltransferase
LAAATDWVGYTLYLDLAKDQHTDQTRHDFPLGGEEDRCRHAIKLAKEGKTVALICSGDAAIYAMAALVYELVDREPNRVAVEVHPGISAFQLASARAGALIGHDFCCISLSDLLTPWESIEQRLKAAAEGDFVVAFYNPRSLKRVDQIVKAFEFLKPHRQDDTPVILASSLGRPEENVRVLRFVDFKPEDVDMLTVVLVGSSQSRAITRGDGKTYAYTPRGYAKKMDNSNPLAAE